MFKPPTDISEPSGPAEEGVRSSAATGAAIAATTSVPPPPAPVNATAPPPVPPASAKKLQLKSLSKLVEYPGDPGVETPAHAHQTCDCYTRTNVHTCKHTNTHAYERTRMITPSTLTPGTLFRLSVMPLKRASSERLHAY